MAVRGVPRCGPAACGRQDPVLVPCIAATHVRTRAGKRTHVSVTIERLCSDENGSVDTQFMELTSFIRLG